METPQRSTLQETNNSPTRPEERVAYRLDSKRSAQKTSSKAQGVLEYIKSSSKKLSGIFGRKTSLAKLKNILDGTEQSMEYLIRFREENGIEDDTLLSTDKQVRDGSRVCRNFLNTFQRGEESEEALKIMANVVGKYKRYRDARNVQLMKSIEKDCDKFDLSNIIDTYDLYLNQANESQSTKTDTSDHVALLLHKVGDSCTDSAFDGADKESGESQIKALIADLIETAIKVKKNENRVDGHLDNPIPVVFEPQGNDKRKETNNKSKTNKLENISVTPVALQRRTESIQERPVLIQHKPVSIRGAQTTVSSSPQGTRDIATACLVENKRYHPLELDDIRSYDNIKEMTNLASPVVAAVILQSGANVSENENKYGVQTIKRQMKKPAKIVATVSSKKEKHGKKNKKPKFFLAKKMKNIKSPRIVPFVGKASFERALHEAKKCILDSNTENIPRKAGVDTVWPMNHLYPPEVEEVQRYRETEHLYYTTQ